MDCFVKLVIFNFFNFLYLCDITEQWKTTQSSAGSNSDLLLLDTTYQNMPCLVAIVDCTNVGPL